MVSFNHCSTREDVADVFGRRSASHIPGSCQGFPGWAGVGKHWLGVNFDLERR
jgi:hypothetical protein